MKKQYNFRLEEDTMKKIEYIATEEERTSTQQIQYLIKKCIKDYEEKNGEIII